MRFCALLLGVCSALGTNLWAGSLLLQQGVNYDASDTPYTGASDTSIRWESDRNYGGLNALNLGDEFKILMRFDLGMLQGRPIKVRQAVLTLTVRPETVIETEQLFRIAPLIPANAAWEPGRQANATAAPGEVSWRWRRHGESGDSHVPWAGGGHFSPADRSETHVVRGAVAPAANQVEISLPPEVVQEWIDRPDTNAGLVIESEDVEQRERNSGEIVSFRQSTYKNPSERPSLRLDYEEE